MENSNQRRKQIELKGKQTQQNQQKNYQGSNDGSDENLDGKSTEKQKTKNIVIKKSIFSKGRQQEDIDKFQQDEQQKQIEKKGCLWVVYKARTIKSSTLYQNIYLILTIIYSLCLVFTTADPQNKLTQVSLTIQTIVQCLFLGGVILRLISLDNIHLGWCSCEFISIISGTACLLIQHPEILPYFKAARCIRILLFARIIPQFYKPFQNFVSGFKNVNKIIVPALVLIYIYSIVGLFAFAGNQYSRCRNPSNKILTANWTYEPDIAYLCGQRKCPIKDNIQLQCLNPINYNVPPNSQELNNLAMGYGFFSYQTIFHSIFNTFKLVFLTGWSRCAILMKQAFQEQLTTIYYISFLYFVSYIYMNIFYGILILNKEDDKQIKKISYIEQSDSTFFQETKQYINDAYIFDNSAIAMVNDSDQNHKNNRISRKQQKFRKIVRNLPKKYLNTILLAVYIPTIKQVQHKKRQIIQIQDYAGIEATENKKKFEEEDKEQANLNKNRVKFLLKDYYLPRNSETKRKIMKAFQIYFYFNNTMIVLSSFNMCTETFEENLAKRRMRNLVDLLFLSQFILHVIGKTIIHTMKDLELERWSQKNKIPVDQKFNKVDNRFKAEIILLTLSLAGILRQIINADTFEDLLMPTLLSGRLLRTCKYVRLFLFLADQKFSMDIALSFICFAKILKKIIPFLAFYLLILTVFALIGFNLFSGLSVEQTQLSFNGVYQSFIFTFMVFYNEQWDLFMLRCFPQKGPTIIAFTMVCLIIGSTVLSKYFMALVMNHFGTELEIEEKLFEKQKQQRQNQSINRVSPLQNVTKTQQQSVYSIKIKRIQESENFTKLEAESPSELINFKFSQQTNQNSISHSNYQSHIDGEEQTPSRCDRFRSKISTILFSNSYVIFYVLLVFVDIADMANRGPLADRKSQNFLRWDHIQKIVTSIYLLQIIIWCIIFGLYRDERSYFKIMKMNYFNFIFTIFCLSSFADDTNDVMYKLRKLKILRLILIVERICYKDKKMRLSFISYTKLFPKLVKFLIVITLIYGFFANILTILYAGNFRECVNFPQQANIVTKQDCLNWGGDWIVYSINTDTLGNSLIYTYLIASTQGWSSLMFQMANNAGLDRQPITNINSHSRIFFIVFFLLGNMIILNIFIGLSIYTVKKIAKRQTGQYILSKQQQQWLLIRQQIHRTKLYKKIVFIPGTFCYYCNKFIQTRCYQINRIVFIIGYLALLSCISTGGQIIDKYRAIKFSFFFMIMGIINCFIYTCGKTKPNTKLTIIINASFLIFMIITGTIISFNLIEISWNVSILLGTAIICFQLFRYWQYLSEVEYVKKVLHLLSIIFPRTIYTLLPMVIILLVYSFVGMQLFAYLKPNTELNQFDQNYKSFFKALFSLLKFSTWQAPIDQIVNAAQELSPNFICFEVNTYEQYLQYGLIGCGNKFKSYAFFLSFHVIYSMILLTSLTANVYDSYCEVQRFQEITKNQMQLEKATEQWLNFDPQGTGFMQHHNFWRFISRLHKIYGLSFQKIMPNQQKQKILKEFNIPIYQVEGKLCFKFQQTIQNLIKLMIMKKYKIDEMNNQRTNQIYNNIEEQNECLNTEYKKTRFTSEHLFSIILLRAGMRRWKLQSTKGVRITFFKCRNNNTKNCGESVFTHEIQQSIQ